MYIFSLRKKEPPRISELKIRVEWHEALEIIEKVQTAWVFQIKVVFSLSRAFVICHKNDLHYNDFTQCQYFWSDTNTWKNIYHSLNMR